MLLNILAGNLIEIFLFEANSCVLTVAIPLSCGQYTSAYLSCHIQCDTLGTYVERRRCYAHCSRGKRLDRNFERGSLFFGESIANTILDKTDQSYYLITSNLGYQS